MGPFHPRGNKLLLFHCLKRATVPLLAIIDLFLFLTIFPIYLNLLFTIIYLIFLSTGLILLSMAFENLIPQQPIWLLISVLLCLLC
jgi:hypothetical protein